MSIESDTVYFSKEFLNNLRRQCGMGPDERTQEEIIRDTRRAVADTQVARAKELLEVAEKIYDEAVARAEEAWKP